MGCAVVIVKKPCGDHRFCVDYRGLNHLTLKDSYPLPRIDESLDFLARGKFLTTLDLTRGYWQVSVEKTVENEDSFRIALWPVSVQSSPFWA